MQRSRTHLKAKFSNGAKPPQEDFADHIDSAVHPQEDIKLVSTNLVPGPNNVTWTTSAFPLGAIWAFMTLRVYDVISGVEVPYLITHAYNNVGGFTIEVNFNCAVIASVVRTT
jgi:hypothetical protein